MPLAGVLQSTLNGRILDTPAIVVLFWTTLLDLKFKYQLMKPIRGATMEAIGKHLATPNHNPWLGSLVKSCWLTLTDEPKDSNIL